MNLRALAVTSLLVACASHPPRVTVVPPPAPAPVAQTQRTPDEALIDDLMREAETFVHPSSGPISARLAERATTRLAELSPDARPRLARALLSWLIARAWGMNQGRPAIRAALSVLGDAGYDTLADACHAPDLPYGCWSLMLNIDDAGHEAMLTRLLARLGSLVSESHDEAEIERTRERLSTYTSLLLRLDRDALVHRAMLAIVADERVLPRLRVELIGQMTRSDLPFVEPALVAIARGQGDVTVREAAIELLGRMVDHAPAEHITALYDSTPPGAAGVSLRAAIGEALVHHLDARSRSRLLAWMRLAGARRAGYEEADRWAHMLARGVNDPMTYPGLRDPTPEWRAITILVWSWRRDDPRLIEALVGDRARLTGPAWREHDFETVGALATWALTHRGRDPRIEFDGCCHDQ